MLIIRIVIDLRLFFHIVAPLFFPEKSDLEFGEAGVARCGDYASSRRIPRGWILRNLCYTKHNPRQ